MRIPTLVKGGLGWDTRSRAQEPGASNENPHPSQKKARMKICTPSVVTFVLRKVFSSRPSHTRKSKMRGAGASLRRRECPSLLCGSDRERSGRRHHRSFKTSERAASCRLSVLFGLFCV